MKNVRSLLQCDGYRPYKTIVRNLVVVSVLSTSALLAHAQRVISQASFSTVEATATGFYSPDSCTTISVNITVSPSGAPSLNASSGSLFASAQLQGYNSCTNTFFFETGSTNSFQLSPLSGSGTKPPQSIVASGQIPLVLFPGGASDVLSFQMTMQPIAGAVGFQEAGSARETIFLGGTSTITENTHVETSFSTAANVSASVATQNGSLMPLTNTGGFISTLKNHQVTITSP